jgi:hypothetical protein
LDEILLDYLYMSMGQDTHTGAQNCKVAILYPRTFGLYRGKIDCGTSSQAGRALIVFHTEVNMAQESTQEHQAFTQIVKDSLQKAQGHISDLRKTNTWLLITSIVSSAATTLVAGGTAAIGPVAAEGAAGWKIACIVAAVFAFTSTVTTLLSQQMKIDERLMQGTLCMGRLRALEVAIAIGSQSWEEITKEYSEIIRAYPELSG